MNFYSSLKKNVNLNYYVDRCCRRRHQHPSGGECSHKNTIVDYRQNDVICTDCGLVVGCPVPTSDTFDRLRDYSMQEDLGSRVEPQHRKYSVAHKRTDSVALSKGERRIRRVRSLVKDLCDQIGVLPRIETRSQSIVKYIVSNKKTVKQVKKDELLCVVSICIACRESKFPYTFRELAAVCENVKPKEICRTYKMYERLICMAKMKINKRPQVLLEPCSYNLMIPRLCGLLGLDFLAQKKIRRRLVAVKKVCYKTKALNPMTKFAVAVLVEFPHTDLNEVHIVTGVSKHTILKSVALFNDN